MLRLSRNRGQSVEIDGPVTVSVEEVIPTGQVVTLMVETPANRRFYRRLRGETLTLRGPMTLTVCQPWAGLGFTGQGRVVRSELLQNELGGES